MILCIVVIYCDLLLHIYINDVYSGRVALYDGHHHASLIYDKSIQQERNLKRLLQKYFNGNEIQCYSFPKHLQNTYHETLNTFQTHCMNTSSNNNHGAGSGSTRIGPCNNYTNKDLFQYRGEQRCIDTQKTKLSEEPIALLQSSNSSTTTPTNSAISTHSLINRSPSFKSDISLFKSDCNTINTTQKNVNNSNNIPSLANTITYYLKLNCFTFIYNIIFIIYTSFSTFITFIFIINTMFTRFITRTYAPYSSSAPAPTTKSHGVTIPICSLDGVHIEYTCETDMDALKQMVVGNDKKHDVIVIDDDTIQVDDGTIQEDDGNDIMDDTIQEDDVNDNTNENDAEYVSGRENENDNNIEEENVKDNKMISAVLFYMIY